MHYTRRHISINNESFLIFNTEIAKVYSLKI